MKFFKDYSAKDQEILASEICPEANETQINYFLRVCEAKNISPFSGLLYLQLRKNNKTGKTKAAVSPTIDGSRVAAARSDEYAGSDEVEYDTEDAKHPNWARKTVWRVVNGERRAFTAKVRWDEFKPAPGQDFQWNAKPYHMLNKCAEQQALRMAFPEYLAGAGDEDDIGEVMDEVAPNSATPSEQEAGQRELLVSFQKAVQSFAAFGFSEEQIMKELGIASRSEVSGEHMEALKRLYAEQKASLPK